MSGSLGNDSNSSLTSSDRRSEVPSSNGADSLVFRCPHCTRSYKSRHYFREHLKAHQADRLRFQSGGAVVPPSGQNYSCHYCLRRFPDMLSLSYHLHNEKCYWHQATSAEQYWLSCYLAAANAQKPHYPLQRPHHFPNMAVYNHFYTPPGLYNPQPPWTTPVQMIDESQQQDSSETVGKSEDSEETMATGNSSSSNLMELNGPSEENNSGKNASGNGSSGNDSKHSSPRFDISSGDISSNLPSGYESFDRPSKHHHYSNSEYSGAYVSYHQSGGSGSSGIGMSSDSYEKHKNSGTHVNRSGQTQIGSVGKMSVGRTDSSMISESSPTSESSDKSAAAATQHHNVKPKSHSSLSPTSLSSGSFSPELPVENNNSAAIRKPSERGESEGSESGSNSSSQNTSDSTSDQNDKTTLESHLHLRQPQVTALRATFLTCPNPNPAEVKHIADRIRLPKRLAQIWFNETRRQNLDRVVNFPLPYPLLYPLNQLPFIPPVPVPPNNILPTIKPIPPWWLHAANINFTPLTLEKPLDLSNRTNTKSDGYKTSDTAMSFDTEVTTDQITIDTPMLVDQKMPHSKSNSTAMMPPSGKASRSFECETCGKHFDQANSLRRHNYEHSGLRPFPCDQCLKCFKHKHHLLEHKRTHSGEKPYRCVNCQKCFSHSGSFSQHINHKSGSCIA